MTSVVVSYCYCDSAACYINRRAAICAFANFIGSLENVFYAEAVRARLERQYNRLAMEKFTEQLRATRYEKKAAAANKAREATEKQAERTNDLLAESQRFREGHAREIDRLHGLMKEDRKMLFNLTREKTLARNEVTALKHKVERLERRLRKETNE